MEGKKFGDDYIPSETFTTQGITVTEAHLLAWAGLTMDYFSLHVDKEFASKTTFGERLAHGPLIFALAVGLVYLSGFDPTAVIAWLGADKMRMTAPVKIGDTIRVVVEVLDVQKTKKPKKGVLSLRYHVKNQRDETVMIFDYNLLCHMRV